MFKQIFTAAVVALGVLAAPMGTPSGAAHAGTVADATPIPGIDPIEFGFVGGGFLTTNGAGGFSFSGGQGTQGTSPVDFTGFVSDQSVFVTQFDPTAFPPGPPSTALAANAAMDVVSIFDNALSAFVIQALYTATANPVEDAFATFLVEIISPTQLDPLAAPVVTDAQARITAVSVAVNVIPLPATGLLLIGGLGGLALLRRKHRKTT